MKHSKMIGRLLSFALTLGVALGLAPSMALPVTAADSDPQIIIKPNDYVSKPTDDAAKNDSELQKELANRFRAYQIFEGQIVATTYDPTLNIHELSVTGWGVSIKKDAEAMEGLLKDLGGNRTPAVDLGVTFDLLKATKDHYLDAEHLQAYRSVYTNGRYWESGKSGEGDMTAEGEAELNSAFNGVKDSLTIGELFKAALAKTKDENAAQAAAQVLADFTPNTGNPELARSFYAFVFAREEYKDGHKGGYKYLKEEIEGETVWESKWDDTYGYWYIGEMEDGDYTLPDGYYMIWDAYQENNDQQSKANASYMAAVYGYGTIELKSEAPHVTKTIENAGGNGASHELGSTISFRLTGTLPQNFFTAYLGYPYSFEDTMAPGLTYGGITRVYVQVPNVGGRFGIPGRMYDLYVVEEYKGDATANQGQGYRYEESADGATFTIKFPNLRELKGKKVRDDITWATDPDPEEIPINGNSLIVVEYTAVLNEGADYKRPDLGNHNSVELRYANNPLWDPAAEHEGGTWNNNWADAPTGRSLDTVCLYDFGVHMTVRDEYDLPLKGAGFTLKKSVYDYKLGTSVDYYAILHRVADEADPTGETPCTYYLAGWVTKAALGDLSGRDWGAALEPGKMIGDVTVPVTASLLANDGGTDTESGYYLAVTTQDDGVVRVVGLEGRSYTLEEVVTPEGYDKIGDIAVSFIPSYYSYGALESLAATVSGGVNDQISILSNNQYQGAYATEHRELVARMEVESDPGENLLIVDTGGVGTTLFYIGGGALLGVAALLLIFYNIQKKKKS